MIHVQFRNDPAGLRVTLQHPRMRQDSSHILIAYPGRTLLNVVSLNLTLVTGNRKLVQTFPGIAMTAGDYLRAAL